MIEKPVCWLGSSLEDLRAFPEDARRATGYQLGRAQQGLMPTDWKPMTIVGSGVYEIRVHTGAAHRIFYVAKSTKPSTSCMRSRSARATRHKPRSSWPASASPIYSVAARTSRRLHDEQGSTFKR